MVTALVLGSVVWLGCGGSSVSTTVPDPIVRFVNASPDSTALNFFLNDDVKASALPFAGSSPPFESITPDAYDVNVKENGASLDLDTVVRTFASDEKTLVISAGLVDFGTQFSKRVRLTFTRVDLTPPNGNKSRIVWYHGFIREAGFETPNIDVASPGDTPTYVSSNIAFGGSAVMDVDAGSQTFDVKRAGVDQIYTSSTLSFTPGKTYLGLVSGVQGATGTQAPGVRYILLN